MNQRLRSHYDNKYSSEGHMSSGELEPIEHSRHPANRFQAAIHYMGNYFPGGSILELGAGNGIVAKSLLSSLPSIDHYCITEFSRQRITGLKKNFSSQNVSIRELDVENINNYSLERYDAIVMIALIEHMIDPISTMKNIKSLCKPGGFVYIDTPNIAKVTRRIKLMAGRFPSTASNNEGLTTYNGRPVDLFDEGHLHYFTYRSLANMLTQYCGFKKIKKLSYPCGHLVLGKRINWHLAKLMPELFSELVLLAYA